MHSPALNSIRSVGLAAALLCMGGMLASSAGAVGTACTTGAVSLSSPDRASFQWTLPGTWASNGSARILARPYGSSAVWSQLATVSGVRTAGTRTTATTIPGLTTGSWSWRVELTPPTGAVDWCDAATPIVITRAAAPTIALSGTRITADGWRAIVGGQTVSVARAAGDGAAGTSYVRFQSPNGIWGTEAQAPVAIPTSNVSSVQAYRRSSSGLTGATTTMSLLSDVDPPAAPSVSSKSITVDASGGAVALGASYDQGSGTTTYEWSLLSKGGTQTGWASATGMRVAVAATDAGGTLYLRACDRVGNCSDPVGVAIEAHSATPGAPSNPTSPTPRTPAPRVVESTPPRITALTVLAPAGGAGRVAVTLSRPAEVTFTVTNRGAAVSSVAVWLGAGQTLVRIPGGPRAVAGATLTAHPVAGAASGETTTATLSLPAVTLTRAAETARVTTRMRSHATAMLYDMDTAVRDIVRPSDGAAGLSGAQGARRQEPSSSALFGVADEQWMVGKVTIDELMDLSPGEMADVIRTAIDDAPSHVVGLDEIIPAAADPAAPMVVGGRVPVADASALSSRLAAAFAALDEPSPYGGTWASRVNVYLAPAMSTAIAAGSGSNHNLGRDGKPHFRTYRTVMAGLARVGGVWMEMYHGTAEGVTSPFSVREWTRAPSSMTAEYRRAGGDPTHLHLLITGSAAYPAGRLPSGCVTPQRCAWQMAESTPSGRAMVANGVGAYRLGAAARPFLAEWQARLS
ncbi:MAG: hypothetical protein ACOYL4_03930 [Miltoncostaeaceae bacterium]